jgi:hypothetical protein
MQNRCFVSGDPTSGEFVLTPAREHMVLRMTVPLFSKSVFPPGARGRSETLVFSDGIFLSTQEVNEWRCHRHESRSDL